MKPILEFSTARPEAAGIVIDGTHYPLRGVADLAIPDVTRLDAMGPAIKRRLMRDTMAPAEAIALERDLRAVCAIALGPAPKTAAAINRLSRMQRTQLVLTYYTWLHGQAPRRPRRTRA